MDVEAEILGVAAAWDAAIIADDAAAFADFVTDDWVYVGPTGAASRAETVGWIASGRLSHHSMRTIAPPRVAVHGDTALITARKASTGSWDGVAYAADEWITEVFVREGERWRCVLSQKCPAEAHAPDGGDG